MKFLVIESERQGLNSLAELLKQDNPSAAVTSLAAKDALLNNSEVQRYDLVVLRAEGYDDPKRVLVDIIGRRGADEPLIVVTAPSTATSCVELLRAGADDVIASPFNPEEFLARVEAILRRRRLSRDIGHHLEVGDLRIDLIKRQAIRNGLTIDLQAKEFSVLELLMRKAGHIVTKKEILAHAWSYNFEPETNVVDVLVHRLREKIDRNFESQFIKTVRGSGYILAAKNNS